MGCPGYSQRYGKPRHHRAPSRAPRPAAGGGAAPGEGGGGNRWRAAQRGEGTPPVPPRGCPQRRDPPREPQSGAAPGAAPASGPPPARRSIPGWAGRADSRARRPPRAHLPGSARRQPPPLLPGAHLRRRLPGGRGPGGGGGRHRRRRHRHRHRRRHRRRAPLRSAPSFPACLPALQDEPGVFPALLAAHHPRNLLGQRQQLAVSSRGRGEAAAATCCFPPGAAEQVPRGPAASPPRGSRPVAAQLRSGAAAEFGLPAPGQPAGGSGLSPPPSRRGRGWRPGGPGRWAAGMQTLPGCSAPAPRRGRSPARLRGTKDPSFAFCSSVTRLGCAGEPRSGPRVRAGPGAWRGAP